MKPKYDQDIPALRTAKLLTDDEEQSLGRRIQAGLAAGGTADGLAAEAELVTANMKLALRLNNKFHHSHPHQADDTMGGAFHGLLLAARQFDPERGKRFATMAGPWILKEIRIAYRDSCRVISIPYNLHAAVNKSRACGEPEKPPRFFEEAKRASWATHLDGMAEIVDTAKDEAEIIEEQKARVAEMAMVSEMIASLPESKKPIADMLFGLNGKPVSTTKEIRKALGVNKDRILQIKKNIIRDMRRKVEEDDFLRNNRRKIREIIDSLPPEQQRIAERLFPTRSKARQSAKAIAAEFGVNDSWVYTIQKKVMRLVTEKSGAKSC